jgi:hypothetical protein
MVVVCVCVCVCVCVMRTHLDTVFLSYMPSSGCSSFMPTGRFQRPSGHVVTCRYTALSSFPAVRTSPNLSIYVPFFSMG